MTTPIIPAEWPIRKRATAVFDGTHYYIQSIPILHSVGAQGERVVLPADANTHALGEAVLNALLASRKPVLEDDTIEYRLKAPMTAGRWAKDWMGIIPLREGAQAADDFRFCGIEATFHRYLFRPGHLEMMWGAKAPPSRAVHVLLPAASTRAEIGSALQLALQRSVQNLARRENPPPAK